MTWFDTAIKTLVDGRDQGCEAGHESHETKMVRYNTAHSNGRMCVFDTDQYVNTFGYCPGDDDVSRTISRLRVWERQETELFIAALERFPGIVIDFGSQIGWYTMLATRMGRDVLAIEGVSEHIKLTQINSAVDHLWQAHHWVCENTPTLSAENCPRVSIVKIDLEGSEQHALRCIQDLISARLVDNILMEVSPVFNDTYPDLVLDLLSSGYSAVVCNPLQSVTFSNYKAVIAQAPQVDMLFTRYR